MKNRNPLNIVKYNGQLGVLEEGRHGTRKGELLFRPGGIGSYSELQLEVVNQSDVHETSLDEKIVYLKMEFVWGKVTDVQIINDGEYIVFKYTPKGKDSTQNETLYHTHLDFHETGNSYCSLDSAIIGLLDYKYQGENSQAHTYFERMLEMPQTE